MITLNTERELVTVDSWAEIEALAGFVKELDPAKHELKAIIGRYLFKEYIACGLSNCRTPHGKGYIVETKEGPLTNIGKDCGRTYFGVNFEELSQKFDRDLAMKENRQKLVTFSFQLDEVRGRVATLRATGMDDCYNKLQPLVTPHKGVPLAIVQPLGAMARARSGALTAPREMTDAEIDALEAREGRTVRRPQYIDAPIAQIAGIQALYDENDLRSLVVNDLTQNLDTFSALDIDLLSSEKLKYWVKWTSSVDALIERAEQIVKMCRTLLTKANLQPFLHVLKDDADAAEFKRYLKSLAA